MVLLRGPTSISIQRINWFAVVTNRRDLGLYTFLFNPMAHSSFRNFGLYCWCGPATHLCSGWSPVCFHPESLLPLVPLHLCVNWFTRSVALSLHRFTAPPSPPSTGSGVLLPRFPTAINSIRLLSLLCSIIFNTHVYTCTSWPSG